MSDMTPLIEKWLSCQTLKYYGSIDESFLDYGTILNPVFRYSDTSGISHSTPFLCAISFISATL